MATATRTAPAPQPDTTLAARHLDKAVECVARGIEFYSMAAEEIRAAMVADRSLTQTQVAERMGRSQGWVAKLLKWDYSAPNNPGPFAEPDRKARPKRKGRDRVREDDLRVPGYGLNALMEAREEVARHPLTPEGSAARKAEGLVLKAVSTTYPEEAALLSAKAGDLIRKHGLTLTVGVTYSRF